MLILFMHRKLILYFCMILTPLKRTPQKISSIKNSIKNKFPNGNVVPKYVCDILRHQLCCPNVIHALICLSHNKLIYIYICIHSTDNNVPILNTLVNNLKWIVL